MIGHLYNFFSKERQALHETSNPVEKWAKGVFQTQSPICGVKFSNNIPINQFRMNERKN